VPSSKPPEHHEKGKIVRVLNSLQAYIREHSLLRAGDRLGVAVSGGADSVALLRAMLALRKEFGILVSVIHVHHGIRGAEADADAEFVSTLANQRSAELHLHHADVPAYAAKHGLSLEAAGRAVRYEFFRTILARSLDRIATAHTRDDQAETVLLRLLRGAGTRGLAGVYRTVDFEGDDSRVIRPLLGTTRAEIEAYLRELGQPWREDESNADTVFLRNRVRHELLPILERDFNPNVREVLSQTAEVSRDEEDFWSTAVAELLDREPFPVARFVSLHTALQRRLLRAMSAETGAPLGFEAVERARQAILVGQTGTLAITGELLLELRRDRGAESKFFFRRGGSLEQTLSYDYEFQVPGQVEIPEAGIRVHAVSAPSATTGGISSTLAGRVLRLRNWRAGDRFHAQGRGSEKKIKELFQIYRIPPEDRALWPVVECDGDIVWVRGLPPAVKWESKAEEEFSVLLNVSPLAETTPK
jgi:tRNA(Ile)-lysidine synthase